MDCVNRFYTLEDVEVVPLFFKDSGIPLYP